MMFNYLPNDILSQICMLLTIKDIETLCKAYNYKILSYEQFWLDYFLLQHINIIEKRNNSHDWIVEFNTCYLIDVFYIMKREPCQLTYLYPDMMKCGKTSEPGSIYCKIHNDNKEITYIFECEDNVTDLIEEFNFIYHEYTLSNNNITTIRIKLNCIDITYNNEYYCFICNETIMYDFLIKLFNKRIIKNEKFII